MTNKRVKLLIGRKEEVDFPKLRLYGIVAKIDTGAYTSAIHCAHVKAVRKDGKRYVRFTLLDPSHPAYDEKEIRRPLLGRKKIKNSFGQTEYRYVIRTKIKLFGEDHEIDLSLSDRSRMEHPILLGRKFIQDKYVVDVSKFNLSSRNKRIPVQPAGKRTAVETKAPVKKKRTAKKKSAPHAASTVNAK